MTSTAEESSTHKVAVEALTELKHASSVWQRPRDAKNLATWNNTEFSS